MLSQQDNDILTRTGPGTPMGNLLRRYWVPALLDWELPAPDCPPVRVQLMSERLVAFRDTQGRVGMLQEACSHRAASLWLGRNDESGLRCVYHGWKFDYQGNCVDQMNEQVSFAAKVPVRAYPCLAIGGVIWTYMGPPGERPPEPLFAWTQAPVDKRSVSRVLQESNWLQAFEGTMDTSHAPILHRTFSARSILADGGAPRVDVDLTDYGYRYFSIRKGPDGGQFIKGYQFVMPWTQIRAGGDGSDGHYSVPIDDQNCVVWNWGFRVHDEGEGRAGDVSGNGPSHVDQKTFRSFRNASNNYMIDREMQRSVNFTGIIGTNTQDRAVQESMGPILDRTQEHLGPSDRQIIVARQLMLEAVKAVQRGEQPRGANDAYYRARAFADTVKPGVDFRSVFLPQMNPEGQPILQLAET